MPSDTTSKIIRVILDTNLWISFLISKTFSKLDQSILDGNIILLFSEELLEEFIDVVSRPKFKKYYSKNDVIETLDVIYRRAEFIDVTSKIDLCRDKKDNFLLELAIDSKANYLITGDKDLLELKKIEATKIIEMRELLRIIKS